MSILTLQRSEASKLSWSFLSRLRGGGVTLLVIEEEVFQTRRFARGSLSAQVLPTRGDQGSADLLQRDLRIFPPEVAAGET